MKKFLFVNKKIILILIIGFLITFLAYHLRLQQFFSFPPVGDTEDEVKYAFNGLSLIKKGVPESWSWWDDYGQFETLHIRNSEYRLVKPYFDDPPGFALLSGGYALSKGMDTYEKVEAGALRWPMLKLGALNVFLLFLLVFLVSGFWPAVIGGLFYATIPTFVLSSRLPLAENFLVTLSLTSLLLLLWYLKKNSKLILILCSLIAASAILVKQTGLFIPMSLVFLLWAHKKTKAALISGLFGLFFLGLWYGYGAYYDWSLFVHLQGVFSGRGINLPKMIMHFFDTPRIAEKMMSIDGWLIWGWISLVIFSFWRNAKEKLSRLIPLVAVGSYLVLFAIMSGHLKGWYRFPFYPFLAWAMAVGLVELFKQPRFVYAFFWLTIPGFASLIAGTGESFWGQPQVKLYQLLFPLTMTPFLLNELRENLVWKRLSQIILIAVFILMIWFNIRTIFFFQDQFWY
ncbi:hypothetical protein FJZ41_00460 [Candidatus Shapirobacteria bacterium]|nr:hypothetical protein [Candidatus Shapirobacteria bacterium]